MTQQEQGGPQPASSEVADASSRRHVRGSTALLGGRLFSMVFTVSTQVVIVRALSKSEFGAFAFALAITSASRVLLSLGQGKSLSRFLTLYDEQRDSARLLGTLAMAAITIAATSLALFVALAVGQGVVGAALPDEPAAVHVLLVLVFLAPMEALDEAFVSCFAVFARVRAIFVRRYLLTPGLRLAVVLAVFVAGGGPVAIAVGYVATQLLGLVFYGVLLTKVLRERGLTERLRPGGLVLPWRTVLSFSFPMLTTELVYLSMNFGSVLLLAVVWGAEQVAEYRAVFPAARINQFVYASFATLYVPMAARLFARGDRSGTRSTYWHTAVLLAVLSFPVFALTGPFAPATTVLLFGAEYAAASPVLLLLSVGFYLNVCLGLNMHTLQVFGRVRYLFKVNVFIAAFNLVLGLLLVPRFGAVGVAAANCAALVAQNALNQWAMRQVTGALPDRTHTRPYLLIAALTVVLGATQLLFAPPFAVAFLLSAAASTALLLASRRALDLGNSFPELARVPVLGRLLRAP